MKIVLDCERMKYPYTGIYEYCYQLAIAMQNTISKEDILSYYIPQMDEFPLGLHEKFIYQKSIHKLFPVEFKTDIIHYCYQLSSYVKGNRKAQKVLTIHDLNFLYEGKNSDKINKYLSKVQKNIDKVDRLVAISNYAKQDIINHLNIGDKPIDVIYNGCNVIEFEDFNTPQYKPTRDFIFSIGTVLPKKNFHILPGILSGNDYELIIAGKQDQAYKEQIISEAKKHGVESRVHLIGTISPQDKYWYLKNCMAFMFPSIAEGFGIPVIEAMHFGKPVFLSTHTSLPEVGGKEAYYFENFEIESMKSVFETGMNDYFSNERSLQIKEHASLFTWERAAKEYYGVYKKM